MLTAKNLAAAAAAAAEASIREQLDAALANLLDGHALLLEVGPRLLHEAGVSTLAELNQLSVDDLVSVGLSHAVAAKLKLGPAQPTTVPIPAPSANPGVCPGAASASSSQASADAAQLKPIPCPGAPAGGSSAQQALRMVDIEGEPTDLKLGPITGVMDVPTLDLLAAATATGVSGADAAGFMGAERGAELAAGDPHSLDANEAGALNMYTMETDLYPTLNARLRARDREALKIFFPYLKLMLLARAKLPPCTGTVWRGVKGVDLRAQYAKGKEFYWWAFSSTTKQLSTLSSPQFVGTSGVRTVFNIQVLDGVDIERYSDITSSEAEVLIYPGSKFKVVDTLEMGGELFMVHLQQLPMPVSLFK